MTEIVLDVLCHLGNVRNVDLSCRGLYFIEVRLFYGEESRLVAPVGMFSCPGKLASTVDGVPVAAAPLRTVCLVNDANKSFHSHSFLIRYKDEVHELNDGGTWRLQVANYKLEMGEPPFVSEKLVLNFRLCFAEFQSEMAEEGPLGDLEFEVAAEQSLQLQNALNGIHEYFPIRFNRSHFIDLDVLVHTAVTEIRVSSSQFERIFERLELQSSGSSLMQAPQDHANSEDFTVESNPVLDQSKEDEDCQVTGATDAGDDCEDGNGLSASTGIPEESPAPVEVSPEPESPPPEPMDESVVVDVPVTPRRLRGSRLATTVPASTSPHRSRPSSRPTSVAKKALNALANSFAGFGDSRRPRRSLSSDDLVLLENEAPHTDRLISSISSTVKMSKSSSSLPALDDSYANLGGVSERAPLTTASIEEVVLDYCGVIVRNFHSTQTKLFELIPADDDASTPLPPSALELQLVRTYSASSLPQLVQDGSALLTMMDILHISAPSTAVHTMPTILEDYVSKTNQQTTLLWASFLAKLPVHWQRVKDTLRSKYLRNVRKFWSRQWLVHTCSARYVREDLACDDISLALLKEAVSKEKMYSEELPKALSTAARGLTIADVNVHLAIEKLPRIVVQQYSEEFDGRARDAKAVRGGVIFGVQSEKTVVSDASYTDPLDVIDLTIGKRSNKILFETEATVDEKAAAVNEPTELVDSASNVVVHSTTLKIRRNSEAERPSEAAIASEVDVEQQSGGIGRGILSSLGSLGSVVTGLIHSSSSSSQAVDAESALHEKNSRKLSISSDSSAVPHLIVLQHGFLGNYYDMRMMQNALSVLLPIEQLHLLSCRSNSNCTDSLPLQGLADNLVEEVLGYIHENLVEYFDEEEPGKISFVGHSLGGLIIRKALENPKLVQFRRRLHVYVSLATPHLGNLYSESQLVSTGMWALLQLKKSPVLRELTLQDVLFSDRRKCCLYRLSQNQSLQYFRKVVLVSSPLDSYR